MWAELYDKAMEIDASGIVSKGKVKPKKELKAKIGHHSSVSPKAMLIAMHSHMNLVI